MQRKRKWDSHNRGPRDNATLKVNYAVPFMLSSKKVRNKADVSKGHQSAEWRTRLSPRWLDCIWLLQWLLFHFILNAGQIATWLLFPPWIHKVAIFLTDISFNNMDGLCPKKCLGFALIASVWVSAFPAAKYLVLFSTHLLHWSFLSQKGTLACQHRRIQAVIYHLSPNQDWQVINHVGWMGIQGKR